MLLGCFFFSLSFIVGYETRIPGYELNSFLFLLVVCCELITRSLRVLGTRIKGLTGYLTEQNIFYVSHIHDVLLYLLPAFGPSSSWGPVGSCRTFLSFLLMRSFTVQLLTPNSSFCIFSCFLHKRQCELREKRGGGKRGKKFRYWERETESGRERWGDGCKCDCRCMNRLHIAQTQIGEGTIKWYWCQQLRLFLSVMLVTLIVDWYSGLFLKLAKAHLLRVHWKFRAYTLMQS